MGKACVPINKVVFESKNRYAKMYLSSRTAEQQNNRTTLETG